MNEIATLECGEIKVSAPLPRIERLIAGLFHADEQTLAAKTVSGVVLHEGEVYAGLVFDAETGDPSHHLVLLPGEVTGNWQQSLDWAQSIGGHLPTRQEQAFLRAQLNRLFEPAWYWSGEQYSSDYAWVQDFYDGSTDYGRKDYEARARAVRRVAYSPL
jgi:hypothetical protein